MALTLLLLKIFQTLSEVQQKAPSDRWRLSESVVLNRYYRIDGECGGWSWCESCWSVLAFLAADATEFPVAGI